MFSDPKPVSGLVGLAGLAATLPSALRNETAADLRDKSHTEMSFESWDNANSKLSQAIDKLRDRLAPLLCEEPKNQKGEQARPRMSAELPEAIMSRSEFVDAKASEIFALISRLAI